MTYMALIYGPPMPPDVVLPPEAIKAWTDYTQALHDAGILRDSNQLESPAMATTLTIRDGKRIVSDGPFAETKEVLGGYYLLECPNLDDALDWAAKCPAASMGGKMEIRPVVER